MDTNKITKILIAGGMTSIGIAVIMVVFNQNNNAIG